MKKKYSSIPELQLIISNDSGSIKRADLDLRTEYLGLETKIFMIEQQHYVIQIMNYLEIFEQIQNDFNQNIRRATDWVEIVTLRPDNFIEEISHLDNVAQNYEGLFLNVKMLQSLLVSRFPKVKILSVETARQNGMILTILVGYDTEDQVINDIKRFVMGLAINLAQIEIIRKDPSSSKNDPIYINDIFLACTDYKQEYSVRDAEFWFNHVEEIYSGKITRPDLFFFDSKKTKCYLDFSVIYSSNLNIRSLVLLYDQIYMSFPLKENFDAFMNQQRLKLDDLVELVERDKLIILLPNTEGMYNQSILNQLYRLKQNSIISKRGINALMAMFYCEQKREYLSFWEGHGDILERICMELAKMDSKEALWLRKYLLWPIWAEKESFQLLTNYGPLKLSDIGINHMLEGIWDTDKGRQLAFNLCANSNPIHIASALQATFFPSQACYDNRYSPEYISAAFLGDIINSYKYCFSDQREKINEYASMLKNNNLSLRLLKTDNTLSLDYILDCAKKYDTPRTLKTILNNLSNQNELERKNKIEEYNHHIAEIGKEKFSWRNGGIQYLLGGTGLTTSLVAPFVSSQLNISNVISVTAMTAAAIDLALLACDSLHIKDKVVIHKIINNNNSMKDDVYILDKLSRIAQIRQF